jgi:formiminoglutamase
LIDAGNITLGDDISTTHEKLANVVAFFLSKKVETIVVIGGGHDFSFGSYKGLQQHESDIIPIINFDAHLDLRPVVGGQINSGTPFSRIIEHFPNSIDSGRALLEVGIQQERNPASLFEYAKKHHIKVIEFKNQSWIPSEDPSENPPQAMTLPKKPRNFIEDHLDIYRKKHSHRILKKLHISLDLDVFSSWIAPGTSASTPFGCPVDDVLQSLETLMSASSSRLLDIAELCPSRDVNGQTSRLAASMVYRALCALP